MLVMLVFIWQSLILLTTAFDIPLPTQCSNCSNSVPEEQQTSMRKQFEGHLLTFIKQDLLEKLNRSETLPTTVATYGPTKQAPINQKAVQRIIDKMRKRYSNAARLAGYTPSEIISFAEEGE